MLVTSRDGLYIFDNFNLQKLKDIKCFGICSFPNNIYFISYFEGEKKIESYQGKLLRLVITPPWK